MYLWSAMGKIQTFYSSMKVRRYMNPIRLMALALVLSACSTVKLGQDFDLQAFEARVQHGVTTRAQVHDWLGDPKSTGISMDTNGRQFEEWTYLHGQGRLPGMKDARFKILQIKFDKEGVVRGYEFSAD